MLIFWAEVAAVSECHEHEAILVGEDIRNHLQSVQLRLGGHFHDQLYRKIRANQKS
jgi:hypothetical protein